MPVIPAAPLRAVPRPGSPWLVRLVLLVALSAGLAGLARPAAHPGVALSTAGTTAVPVTPIAAGALVPQLDQPVSLVTHRSRASRSLTRAPLWVRPVDAPLVSPYGPRWGSFHPGIDLGAHYGAPIHAVGAGVVIGAGYLAGENGYGQIVLIQHSPGVVTAYAHTSRYFVHAGQHVTAGQVIGLVGATGHVTGPHLHFEVRLNGVKVNPVPWLRAHGIFV